MVSASCVVTGAAAWAIGVTVRALPRMTISIPLAVSTVDHRDDLADEFQPARDRHVDIAQDEVDYIALDAASASAPFAASTTSSSSMLA